MASTATAAVRPSSFTPAQLDAYLTHIGLGPEYGPAGRPARDYALLHALHVHQLAAVPYENLLLHYAAGPTRAVSINPQHLYAKIVAAGRGRGGYCMETCVFFNHVLRAMGFDAYLSGARIRLRDGAVPRGDYVGWSVSHAVPQSRSHGGGQQKC